MHSVSKTGFACALALGLFGTTPSRAADPKVTKPTANAPAPEKPNPPAPEKSSATPKENWCLQKAQDAEGNLVLITSNLGYQQFARKAAATWLLQINVKTVHQNPRGLPTDDEAEALNKLEDQLTDGLRAFPELHYIGRVTAKGARELVYYIKDPKPVDAWLTRATKTPQPREWEYQITSDPEWKHADDLIGNNPECL